MSETTETIEKQNPDSEVVDTGNATLWSFEREGFNLFEEAPEPTAEPQAPVAETTTETPETPAPTETPEGDDEEDAEDPDAEPVSIFAPKKGKGLPTFKSTEEALAHVKDKLGFDLSKPEGYAKLVDNYNKQRANAQKAKELEDWREDAMNGFAMLPEPILQAIQAFNENKDWKQVITSQPQIRLDLNKDFDAQDKWTLIEAYASDIIEKEDFDDDPQSPQVKAALRVAEKSFRADKREHDLQRDQMSRLETSKKEGFKNSVQVSVERVKTDFPGIAEKDAKRIEKLLSGDGIVSMFKNEDGTYKPDAAKNIALIEFAPKEIERLTKTIADLKAKLKTQSDKTADVVLRGRDTVADEAGDKSRTDNPSSVIPAWMQM